MIVCSCRAISDRDLSDAARAGLTHAEIVAQTGVGTDCGCCREVVADILSQIGPCRGSAACSGCPRRSAA
jgi:bacterioferritin-associated ferredoxin